MNLLQARNIARERRTHRIRHPGHGEDYLDLTHTIESSHMSRNFPPYQEPRQLLPPAWPSRCKSFITFHIKAN